MGTTGTTSRCKLLTVAAAAALAAAPLGALTAQTAQDSAAHRTWNVPTKAPTTTNPNNTTTSPVVPQAGVQAVADTAFIRQVRTDNLLETRLGTLARQRASNSAVKQFAQQMVTDHTRMGSQWAALVTRNALPSNVMLDATQQQLISRLTSLSGAEFDREYMGAMVQDHQQNIAAFQRLGPSARSADVRQLAANGLPTLEQHLTMAQQVANQVGAAVATTPTGLPGPAQPGPVATNRNKVGGNAVRADQDYVREVSQDHAMEVELAQLAQQKARDPKVKQFADNMLNDFKEYRDRWADLASNNGASLSAHLGRLHQEKVDRLKHASRDQFDRVYLDIVREHLASMVPYFQKEGRQAQSPQVRNLVDKELPTIQQHLSRAENLGRQAQANAKSPGRDKDRDKDRDKSLSTNK